MIISIHLLLGHRSIIAANDARERVQAPEVFRLPGSGRNRETLAPARSGYPSGDRILHLMYSCGGSTSLQFLRSRQFASPHQQDADCEGQRRRAMSVPAVEPNRLCEIERALCSCLLCRHHECLRRFAERIQHLAEVAQGRISKPKQRERLDAAISCEQHLPSLGSGRLSGRRACLCGI